MVVFHHKIGKRYRFLPSNLFDFCDATDFVLRMFNVFFFFLLLQSKFGVLKVGRKERKGDNGKFFLKKKPRTKMKERCRFYQELVFF